MSFSKAKWKLVHSSFVPEKFELKVTFYNVINVRKRTEFAN